MVHTKLYVPADVIPFTADVGDEGVVIVAVEVVLHAPVPAEGVLPASVAVPGLEQMF